MSLFTYGLWTGSTLYVCNVELFHTAFLVGGIYYDIKKKYIIIEVLSVNCT